MGGVIAAVELGVPDLLKLKNDEEPNPEALVVAVVAAVEGLNVNDGAVNEDAVVVEASLMEIPESKLGMKWTTLVPKSRLI